MTFYLDWCDIYFIHSLVYILRNYTEYMKSCFLVYFSGRMRNFQFVQTMANQRHSGPWWRRDPTMAESSLLVHYLNRNSADSLSGRKVLRFEPRYSTVWYKDWLWCGHCMVCHVPVFHWSWKGLWLQYKKSHIIFQK